MRSLPQLSIFGNCTVAQLKKLNNLPLAHLHKDQRLRTCSTERKKPDRTRSTWAGSFQRKRWFLCCQRCTAFFLWVVLKDQTGRKRPYPPTIQNRLSLNASINYRFNYQSQFTKIEHFKFKNVSPQDQGLLSNNIKWIQLICLQLPFWKMQVTSVLYISPSFIHTWKKHKKASPTQPQKNKCIPTVFNHTKLCIYYAIRKSFTDSWLTVLPKQDIVTNCKGIAMRHLARQWKLKHMTLQMTLRDALMRKESCTYNELRVPDGLGYWKHTGHTTLKNAKEKAFPNSNPHPPTMEVV